MKISPKQKLVQNYILNMIGNGMRKGDLLPTIAEFADILEVSPMTVNKAVNGLVKQDILYKTQGKGTFLKIDSGFEISTKSFPKTNGKGKIAFITPFFQNDAFMKDITVGVMEGIDSENYSLETHHVWIPKFKEETVLRDVAERQNGIILISHLNPEVLKVIDDLLDQGYPIVFLDIYPTHRSCFSVASDNEDAAIQATEYLINNGHRKIVHLFGEPVSSGIERIKGYERTMNMNNLEPVIYNSEENMGKFWKLFDNDDRTEWPTAVFAYHDALAVDLMKEFGERGIDVPEDVSVIGFNDDVGMEQLEVPLTTITQSKRQMGYKAVQLLEGILAGKCRSYEKFFLQTKIIERESVKNINK